MRSSTPRRFTVLDAMVLISATGISLLPIRHFYWEGWQATEQIRQCSFWELAWFINETLAPLALALGFALGLLRLRNPRPRLRRLARQPGTAALLCINIYTLLELFITMEYVYFDQHVRSSLAPYPLSEMLLDQLQPLTVRLTCRLGTVVGAAWIVLWLGRSWRAEPSWIDRAARAMGIYWLLSMAMFGWRLMENGY
jgi:hypothetical protein